MPRAGTGYAEVERRRREHGAVAVEQDRVILETPVALVYNGISHVVMMATPVDLEDFALGFSLTEGILQDPGELLDLEVRDTGRGLELELRITNRAFAALNQRRRNLTGRTGCGLCGAESLEQALPRLAPVGDTLRLEVAALERAVTALGRMQTLQRLTGGAHSACWVSPRGEIALQREDVGRHNALDKLLGSLWRGGRPDPATGFVLVSSRASYEMVLKTAVAGIELLAAVSAPTTLAIETAVRCGVTLAAYCRAGRQAVYTRPARIALEQDGR